MADSPDGEGRADALDVPLDRDVFLCTLLRELSKTLEEVVGVQEASGYISVVGISLGEAINDQYRRAFKVSSLSRRQVADVLVDLKHRIQGDFHIIEETADRIVLGSRTCPFGDKVLGRRPLCMVTSNILGHIAADNLGYGKVELRRTIAAGDPQCVIVVHLAPTDEALAAEGREYVRSVTRPHPSR